MFENSLHRARERTRGRTRASGRGKEARRRRDGAAASYRAREGVEGEGASGRRGGRAETRASAMVATRRARSNNAAPAGKKVLKDVTNARGRELPGKIQDAGPQTAPPNEGAIARRTRSSRKKPLADVGRTGDGPIATEDPAEATEPVRLEEKFERAADEERGKKKRKALEVIEIDQNVQPRRTRRAARQAGRKSTGTSPTPLFLENLASARCRCANAIPPSGN